MYSDKVKKDAQYLFEQGCTTSEVFRALNGPVWKTVWKWHHEYLATGSVEARRVYKPKYTDDQKRAAVDHYLANGKNQSKTVRELGYPSCSLLCQWVDELVPGERKKTKPHKRANEASLDEKAELIVQCYSGEGVSVKKTASDSGVDPVTFYNWRNWILGEKAQDIVDSLDEAGGAESPESLRKEIRDLKVQIRRLKLEKAVWEGAADLVKKDPGVDPANLTNREKATLIDALRSEFTVEELLEAMSMPKSSYYYQRTAIERGDKYADLRIRVKEIFVESDATFGSERIWAALRTGDESHEPVVVSEKVIRRIMGEEGLVVVFAKKKKKRKWSSYGGEVDEAPENLVKRDFHAGEPNRLWLTDITEFSLPFGKAYLSPVIDCFDGMVVSWKVSKHPTGGLATSMLEEAAETLSPNHCVTCHSDRGLHYRTNGWIDMCAEYGITRSMSKKGCSPDNSACEGFFGRLKNEFFYYRDWQGVTYEEFVARLREYIGYYNTRRIKKSLGWKSPLDYRRDLGLAA